MEDKLKIIQDISLLYELSLAMGESIDATKNCKQFLQVLMSRKNFSFASIWVKTKVLNYSEDTSLTQFYATPKSKATVVQIPSNHFICEKIKEAPFVIIEDSDPNFSRVVQDNQFKNGYFYIYRLLNIGFLKLYSKNKISLDEREGLQLVKVVKKFAMMLGGCYAFARLGAEQDQKMKIQEELSLSREKYRMVVKNLSEGLMMTDLKGQIIFLNKRLCDLTGYSKEELQEKIGYEIFIDLNKQSFFKESIKKCIEGDQESFIIEHVHKNGKEWKGEIKATSIKNAQGEVTRILAVITDVTEQLLAKEKLINAKKEAEQARLAEQQFLANMSHEIRTPMNAVIGMTHLLYETNPTNDQKEYLDSLRFSADSLMGIINNILDLSKIEAGELVFEKRAFNLLEMLKALQQTFQFKVREKPVSVVIDFDARIANHLIGDSTRLIQILTNLLGNASKFTRKGTIGINAKLIVGNEKQYVIQFHVHDTGIGIDKDKIELIFENFKQADIAVHRKFGGTGLGLTIVKQLVEIQGGSIEVQSAHGKGSNFIVSLPFENSGVLMTEKTEEDEPIEDPLEVLESLNILVVEDNSMNQKLVKKILNLWNCSYEFANNGIEGVELSSKKRYDLILMDIHMPEMDGVEATQNIRQDNSNPNHKIPIIALTAAALLDEKNRSLDAGMNDFLTKPFSPIQLKNVILKWIKGDTRSTKVKVDIPVLQTREEILKVDLSYLQKMSKGDSTFMKDMINIFLKEIPVAIEKMLEDYDSEFFENIGNIAHRIKSNYMMLGMSTQREIALEIELMMRNNEIDFEELPKLLNRLKNDSRLAYPILEEKLANYMELN